MNSAALKTGLLSVFGLAVSAVAGFAGCGSLLEVPKDHFNAVNHLGYVTYWDKIADIDIGEDAPLPIVIGFQSNRKTSSPYLGYGWLMPLLESYVVQTGEDTFEIMKPAGYTSGFSRDPRNASVLGGVQGWKGEIGSDTIKVWAPCGWSLSYTRGKLTEIGTPKGKQIVLKRDLGGQVEDVTMDGRVLVKVLKGFGGRVEGLEVDGKKLGVELDEKPRVQSVQEKNLITGKDLSLVKIGAQRPGGVIQKIYQYGLTDVLQPKMICQEAGQPDREIIWNADSGLIVSDGGWKYNILPSEQPGHNAAIERVSSAGRKEFWHYDAKIGQVKTLNADGDQTVTNYFSSGVLAGMFRNTTRTDARGFIVKRSFQYDERGRLMRDEIWDSETKKTKIMREFIYGSGDNATQFKDDQFVSDLDKNGKVTKVRAGDKFRWQINKKTDGTTEYIFNEESNY